MIALAGKVVYTVIVLAAYIRLEVRLWLKKGRINGITDYMQAAKAMSGENKQAFNICKRLADFLPRQGAWILLNKLDALGVYDEAIYHLFMQYGANLRNFARRVDGL